MQIKTCGWHNPADLRREEMWQQEPATDQNVPRLNVAESKGGGYIVHKMRIKLNKYLNITDVGKLHECLTQGHEKTTKLDFTQEWTRK